MKPYHFLILRYQFSASLGEKVNVGVVLISLDDKKVVFDLNTRSGRLSKLYPGFDGHFFRSSMTKLQNSWNERVRRLNSDQIELFQDKASLLDELRNTLLPVGENTLVWSEVMGGIDPSPLTLLDELFHEFVTQWDKGVSARHRINDKMLRENVKERLALNKELYRRIQPREITGRFRKYSFDFCWKNGKTHVLEPISLDYENPQSIVEKAERWTGRLSLLEEDFEMISVLAKPTAMHLEIDEAYEKAKAILSSHPKVRMAISDTEMDTVEATIKNDLALA